MVTLIGAAIVTAYPLSSAHGIRNARRCERARHPSPAPPVTPCESVEVVRPNLPAGLGCTRSSARPTPSWPTVPPTTADGARDDLALGLEP